MNLNARALNLGKLIDRLEAIDNKSLPVYYDSWGLVPYDVDSYRGYYEDLALGYAPQDSGRVTVQELLDNLNAAVDHVFHGYKGGDYAMNRESSLWVSNYSHCDSRFIVDVKVSDYSVQLVTAHEDDSESAQAGGAL